MTKLTEQEITKQIADLDQWKYVDGAIEKTFLFQDFKEAFSIMTRIAFECEGQNHHPDWYNVYNRLRIRLNTHDAGGVTDKDFRLALAIEDIVGRE